MRTLSRHVPMRQDAQGHRETFTKTVPPGGKNAELFDRWANEVEALQAKLDSARQVLEWETKYCGFACTCKAHRVLAKIWPNGQPSSDAPISGIPKLGEVMIPTDWWNLLEKEMTAAVLEMAKRIREQTEKFLKEKHERHEESEASAQASPQSG